MTIKRGILQNFDPATYTASVLLFEATSCALSGIPVSNTIDGTSALPGDLCAILFFDEQNPQDAVVLATFANGSAGIPAPTPGRLSFVPGYQQFNAVTIALNSTQAFTLIGGTSGIPPKALGVAYKAFMTSATVGAYIQLAPHAAIDITAYAAIGNIMVANSYLDGTGLLALDATGKIDIKANGGDCIVTLYTYGYVI